MVSTVESVISLSTDWNTLPPNLLSWYLAWKVYTGSHWPNFPLTSTRWYLFFLIRDCSWTKQLIFKSQFSSSPLCQCQDIMSQMVHAHSQFSYHHLQHELGPVLLSFSYTFSWTSILVLFSHHFLSVPSDHFHRGFFTTHKRKIPAH